MKKLIALLLLPSLVLAVDLTYSWDFNTDETTGYRLWMSPNIGLTNSTLLGVTTNNAIVVTHTNAFVGWAYVTATNSFGLESDKSAPIKVDLRKPNKPLKVTVTLN